MKIICKKTTSKDLDLKEVTTIHRNDYEYGLVLEKEYLVMGLIVYKGSPCLHYLIDENGMPDWYPYLLFEVSDPKVFDDWYVAVLDKRASEIVHFLSGFYELCMVEEYHDLLVQADYDARVTYFQRKIEAEAQADMLDTIHGKKYRCRRP